VANRNNRSWASSWVSVLSPLISLNPRRFFQASLSLHSALFFHGRELDAAGIRFMGPLFG
jgi:hypothetical protein